MINKVILVGNVGADPEIKTIESGVKMARIRLPTTERVYNKEKNESKDVTEWHSITLWRGLADVVDRYVRKGTQLYIEGKLRTREYEKNGVKCYATEIVGEELKMLGRKEAHGSDQTQASKTEPEHTFYQPPVPDLPVVDIDNDLPF